MEESDFLQRIVDNMKKDKPWAKMEGTAVWFKEQKEKFDIEFGGQGEVDSSCVTRFLNHPLVIGFFDNLIDLASKGEVVKGGEMVNITDKMLPITHIKQAHREEIWKKFTLGHYNNAVKGPDKAYPYVDASQVDMDAARQTGRVHLGHREGFQDGEEVYIRDLENPDPLVRDDPLAPGQEDNRELLVGKCTVVEQHKTGRKYPAYIWFSQYDVVYLRAYESIRFKFLESIGKDGDDLTSTFFINSKGESYLGSGRRMDWTWFKQINNLGKFTGHKTRKIFSNHIKNKKSAVWSEAREFTMCNSDTVDKDFYQSQIRKKAMALMSMASYSHEIRGTVETGVRSDRDVPYFSEEQRMREQRLRAVADRQTRDKFFEAEDAMLVRVKPTLRRLITPRVRKALVDCLCACQDRYITTKGNMLKIFATGDAVSSKACAKLILRMIYILPEELACVKVIKDNMLTFAELSEEVADISKLEWKYAWKLLEIIRNIKKAGVVESSAMIYSLAKVNKAAWEEGNFLGYSFGNVNLRMSIQLMLAQEQNKEKQYSTDTTDRRTKDDFMAERQLKTLAYIEQRKEEKAAEHDMPHDESHDETYDEPQEAEDLGKDWDRPGRTVWTDEMKLELLRVWITDTCNPMVRAPTFSGKGPYKAQLNPVVERMSIIVDGEKVKLNTMIRDTDTLAQFLQGVQGKGLSGQRGKAPGTGGLVHIIDEWLEGQPKKNPDQTVEYVKSSCVAIINYARETYC